MSAKTHVTLRFRAGRCDYNAIDKYVLRKTFDGYLPAATTIATTTHLRTRLKLTLSNLDVSAELLELEYYGAWLNRQYARELSAALCDDGWEVLEV